MEIILITGGQRSGKSGYAQKVAQSKNERPVYLATSRIWDEEHRQRILRHQADRKEGWDSVEEEKYLSKHNFSNRVVVIDCVTLWCTNFFFDADSSNLDDIVGCIKQEFDKLITQNATFIFVTNEIGSGGISENMLQRRFTDLQGWINQYIASKANQVIWMVSGIPVEIKNNYDKV